MKRVLTCVVAMLALGCVSPATAAESTVGIAYDSVTKLVFSEEPSLRPEDFDVDFRAGLPNSNCASSLKRRYITTQRERVEDVCMQDVTIVDCNARTATMLALGAKTYLVVSLDAPYNDGMDAAFAWEAGTGVKMTSSTTIERTALGPRKIAGVLTDEYKTLDKQVGTSSMGATTLSITTADSWTYYFLPTPLPELACIDVAAPWLARYGTPQRYEPELEPYFEAWMERLRKKKYGFEITESGLALPPWRLALYSIGKNFQHQTGGAAGAGFDFTTIVEVESGHIRPIQSDDTVFTVPP